MKIDSGKIGSISLIAAGILWEYLFGWIRPFIRGFTPSIDTVKGSLFVEIPILLICLGIWLPRSKASIYVGRLGLILWLLPMGLYTIIIFGELEHAEPIALLVYFIVLLSTIAVMISLWMPEKRR